MTDDNDPIIGEPDEEIRELMESHDIDQETAEHIKEIMEEYGVDEDIAIELEGA